MKIYRLELLSNDGQRYIQMATGSEENIKKEHGDIEGSKIIAGKHEKWHLTETFEIPDQPSEV